MANYATLKSAIQQVIKTNGNNEITGALLQQSLLAMINSLGGYYQFAGIATPSTNPGTPDQNVFYIGGAGTYSNFSSLVIPTGYIGVLKYNGTWTLETVQAGDVNAVKFVAQTLTDNQKIQARTNIEAASNEQVSQLEAKVDDIDTVLDVETTTEEVTERFAVEEHIGYIASYGLVPRTSGLKRYSDPFLLRAGETLTMFGITENNVYRLASYNPDTQGVTPTVIGQSANVSVEAEYQSTYTAENDIWLIVGWNASYVFELSKTYEKTTSSSKLDELDAVVSSLEIEAGEVQTDIPVAITAITGEAYANSGNVPTGWRVTVYTYATYSRSDFFQAKKGDIIRVQTNGCGTNVALLAYKSGNTVYATIYGNNSTQDATFAVPLDGEFTVSYVTNNGITVTITRTEYSAASERIDRIEQTISGIPAIEEANERILSETESHINDDLTEDIVSGYYIHRNGNVSQNASYGYKEYQVKAGAEIEYTAYVHPNFAVIAKKLSNTTYEALVTTDVGYRTESFSYVCQEDMTIAVSFRLNATRSIQIDTELVASNTKNIGILFNKIDAENSDALVQDIDFGFMFNRIAVIGDSLASGRVEGIVGQSDAAGSDYYGFSWPSFLSKRWRCDRYVNYSRAGQHTSDWITEWLPVMQADPTIYDAYFIALGTNNEYNETNPSGDQANYEAFVERYNAIIDAVRTKAPHAVIFLVSLYEKRAGNTTLEEIAEERMATDKSIYYIDYANTADYLRYSPEVNWRGHFSSTGYAYVASVINQIVNRIVWENKTEEFWQQFAKYHNIDNDFGTTAKRPSASAVGVGFTYYDTTIGKMIMSNGTAWVNLDGTAL